MSLMRRYTDDGPGPPNELKRILSEVAAKRAILARYGEYSGTNIGEHLQWSQEQQGLGFALRAYAAVYSDHPDYRQEWAPAPATLSP